MERQVGLRTIYGQRDLERASQAPGKIVDMYESMKGGPESGFVSLLSGSLGEEAPPAPPKLAVANPEHTDSGLGDDVVETDHVALETQTAALEEMQEPEEVAEMQEPPLKAISARPLEKPLPRRPRRTIHPAPGTKMSYTQPREASGAADSGLGDSSVGLVAHVPAVEAEGERQRLQLQNQWQRILFQQQLHYLLPNRDGDT